MAINAILIAYLLGCIPTGIIVAKVKGVNLRAAGSGNIGATNALRVMGKAAGILTLLGDMLKGLAGVYIAYKLSGGDSGIPVIAGTAAVLGHDFPVFLGFKGGKGVATSFGVMFMLSPVVAALSMGAWLFTVLAFRISSLGALVSFTLMPAMVLLLHRGNQSLFLLSLFMTGLIILKHMENIARLAKGVEPKISRNAAKS